MPNFAECAEEGQFLIGNLAGANPGDALRAHAGVGCL